METSNNPFVTPVNIETIEAFMKRVGYQGVVDKDFMNNVKQKKKAIQYPRFNKLIITDSMKKFSEIPQRIEENYHSIKDDSPLVSVYTNGDARVRGMLIPDEFLTEESRTTDDFKEYETVFMNVDVLMNQPITIKQQKVVKRDHDDDDYDDRLEPGSHKDNPEHVDDDDDKDDEKVEEDEGGEMGSLETRTEETQKTIPTSSRSPRTILSSDKNITQELTDTIPLPTTTTSQTSHSKCGISSKYSHLPGALRRMCRRQGYMIQNMERKCVTAKQFWKTHNNLKPCIAATIIKYRDAFHSEVPDLVSQEFNTQAPKIIEELFKNYVQSNVIQVHPTTTTSTETTSSADLQKQLYFKMKKVLKIKQLIQKYEKF
ncbi:hypothetical protein Tco_1306361 [Tanacetum coccineum]